MQFDTRTISATEILLMQKYGKSALTIQEAAVELDVGINDVEQMLLESRLPIATIGGNRRISVTNLARVIDGVNFEPVHYPAAKHLVNDILDEVLKGKKKSCRKLSSYKWYCYHAEHIRKHFAGVNVEDVDPGMLEAFLRQIVRNTDGKQMSQRFVQVITCLLKSVFKLSQKYMNRNPFDDLGRLPTGRKNNSRRRTLSKQTVWRLTYALESSDIFRPIIILMLRSGLRIGEVLALRWSDIDRDNGVIHVEQGVSIEYDEDKDGSLINRHYEIGDTKTSGSIRDVPVDAYAFAVLDDWKNYVKSKPYLVKAAKRQGNEDIVFINRYGRVRNYQTLRHNFKSFLEKNGLGDVPITFHRFRHTYATLLQEAGVDVNIIRELLGHADITTTTEYYINVGMEPMKKASQLLSDKLKEILPE